MQRLLKLFLIIGYSFPFCAGAMDQQNKGSSQPPGEPVKKRAPLTPINSPSSKCARLHQTDSTSDLSSNSEDDSSTKEKKRKQKAAQLTYIYCPQCKRVHERENLLKFKLHLFRASFIQIKRAHTLPFPEQFEKEAFYKNMKCKKCNAADISSDFPTLLAHMCGRECLKQTTSTEPLDIVITRYWETQKRTDVPFVPQQERCPEGDEILKRIEQRILGFKKEHIKEAAGCTYLFDVDGYEMSSEPEQED